MAGENQTQGETPEEKKDAQKSDVEDLEHPVFYLTNPIFTLEKISKEIEKKKNYEAGLRALAEITASEIDIRIANGIYQTIQKGDKKAIKWKYKNLLKTLKAYYEITGPAQRLSEYLTDRIKKDESERLLLPVAIGGSKLEEIVGDTGTEFGKKAKELSEIYKAVEKEKDLPQEVKESYIKKWVKESLEIRKNGEKITKELEDALTDIYRAAFEGAETAKIFLEFALEEVRSYKDKKDKVIEYINALQNNINSKKTPTGGVAYDIQKATSEYIQKIEGMYQKIRNLILSSFY